MHTRHSACAHAARLHDPAVVAAPDGVIVEVAEDRQPGGGQEGGDGGYHEAFQEYCLYARRR